MPLEVGYREELEVGFAGQRASQAPDGVFHAAFLPRTMGIAEEGLDAEGSVKPVMLSELVSVVEADGFAHCLGKFAELTADGPSGADRFSIEWLVNHVEAGLPFVENKQPLATSGEQHEVGFPMARCPTAFDLGGAFDDRAPLFDEAGGAASWTMPSCSFVARQQTVPAILLSRTMIDETID